MTTNFPRRIVHPCPPGHLLKRASIQPPVRREVAGRVAAAIRLLTAISLSALLFGCGDNVSFEQGGSSYATVSRDVNDPCRVMVTDMGRASPPIKPFSARIEGCK